MYDVSQSHSASDRISEANKLPAFGVEKSCFLIAKGTTCSADLRNVNKKEFVVFFNIFGSNSN